MDVLEGWGWPSFKTDSGTTFFLDFARGVLESGER